jgi:UDP-N-acetylglucosamine--N-acetylmuramyl-(pentapeptide) pyrophosphoryl-undecaprenol N-acetylglucosamine transferase
LFVPYAFATDDHQTANARALHATGGAWVMAQADFVAPALTAFLTERMARPDATAAAAEAMHGAGRPEAADRLADAVEDLVGARARPLETAA